jgi:hypothetical protein
VLSTPQKGCIIEPPLAHYLFLFTMQPKTTPKDFFLWAGAMITLYSGVVAFITLLFDYINYTFPDPLRYYTDPYQSSIPYAMASLIVLTPVFMSLMRVIRKNIEQDASRAEIWVRRWALFLTVFAAGATIIIDLIVLITTFLRGEEITIAFLLKVLVVLLVAGTGFMHFLADIWGFWRKYPNQARSVNWGVGVLVLVAIVAGFLIVGTPQDARQKRLDTTRVNDLQTIQYQLVYYWQQKQKLPTQLTDLNDSISGFNIPRDPQTGEMYTYTATGPLSFKLCANFNRDGAANNNGYTSRPMMPEPVGLGGGMYDKGVDNWQHAAGNVCFTRTIDPERYPPITPPKK